MEQILKSKEEICGNWLQRYTKTPLDAFSDLILLTNFNNYLDIFCQITGSPTVGYDANMRCVTAQGITMINFGMGSPNAALIMDLLSSINPRAVLFLGKTLGALRHEKNFDRGKNDLQVGDDALLANLHQIHLQFVIRAGVGLAVDLRIAGKPRLRLKS